MNPPIEKAIRCGSIAGCAIVLYLAVSMIACVAAFFGSFGLVVYWACWIVMAMLPVLALANIIGVFVDSIELAILFALMVTPVLFTFFQPHPHGVIDQTSVRSERYEGVIVTRKERVYFTLGCLPPQSLFDGHFRCWRYAGTAFDVYVLNYGATHELKKVASMSFGPSFTERDFGPLASRFDSHLDIKGWDPGGKVYLQGSGRKNSDDGIMSVDVSSAIVTNITSLPANLIPPQLPGDSLPCLRRWEGEGYDPTHHDRLAISGPRQSITTPAPQGDDYPLHSFGTGQAADILTDQENSVKRAALFIDDYGELKLNPSPSESMPDIVHCN